MPLGEPRTLTPASRRRCTFCWTRQLAHMRGCIEGTISVGMPVAQSRVVDARSVAIPAAVRARKPAEAG